MKQQQQLNLLLILPKFILSLQNIQARYKDFYMLVYFIVIECKRMD